MAMGGRSAFRDSGARLIPWAVLAVGLAATGILYGSISRTLHTRNQKEFDGQIERLTDMLDDAVTDQVAVLHAVAGAVSANPDIDHEGFARLYDNLRGGITARVPASIGLAFHRPWAKRDELAREAARRGVPHYRFRPASPRRDASAVVLIQPFMGNNLQAPGFDMHAEPNRARAIDRALATRGPSITTSLVLALDSDRRPPPVAFLLYLPVYADAGSTRLVGVAFSGLRADALFATVHWEAAAAHMGIHLASPGEGEEATVLDFSPGGKTIFHRSETIDLPKVGGSLRAEFSAGKDFGTPPTILPTVLPVGGALSLLLFVLAGSLCRVHEATERRESEQTLLAEVGRLTAEHADDPAVLQKIAAAAARTFGAACRIDLLETGGGLMTVNAHEKGRDALLAMEREFPRLQHDAMFRAALETGVVQRGAGYVASGPEHARKMEPVALGPVAVVPLWLRDHALGAITLTRERGQRSLGDGERALAESIAGRLALGIENQRLYRDLERRVEERTRDLEASNRELESFCYSVSHDLRTPLRSLDGFGQVLQKDYAGVLDAQGMDFLARIRAATRRMDELITALLTLSRLTRREIVPSTVDVTAMVRDAMRDLDPEGKVSLNVEEGLAVQADPRMMAVVLDNLLGNAIKFSARDDAPRIEVGLAEDGEVFVRDNGAGFDMAYASKLFQPFERLHSVREFPGHGIGLATVERIVHRHGGEVRAEGQPGEGATFFVKFPD